MVAWLRLTAVVIAVIAGTAVVCVLGYRGLALMHPMAIMIRRDHHISLLENISLYVIYVVFHAIIIFCYVGKRSRRPISCGLSMSFIESKRGLVCAPK